MGRSQEEWNRFNLSPGDRAKPSYYNCELPFVAAVGDLPDLLGRKYRLALGMSWLLKEASLGGGKDYFENLNGHLIRYNSKDIN